MSDEDTKWPYAILPEAEIPFALRLAWRTGETAWRDLENAIAGASERLIRGGTADINAARAMTAAFERYRACRPELMEASIREVATHQTLTTYHEHWLKIGNDVSDQTEVLKRMERRLDKPD